MDIACFLCSNGPGSVGPTPDYDPVPKLPPETEPVAAPFRERLLGSSVFRCLPNELGMWNVEPGVYHHLPESHGPQHPGAEAILLELEREGRIERAGYWGPKSLEHFAPATLYTWRASTRAWYKRAKTVRRRNYVRNERKFTRMLRIRAGLVRGRTHV